MAGTRTFTMIKPDAFEAGNSGAIFKMIEEETEESELKIKSNTIPAEFVSFYKKLKEIENRTGMQMRLPFDIVFN